MTIAAPKGREDMGMPDLSTWLTVHEVARRLQSNARYVYQLIARGYLIGERAGSSFRIEPASVDTFEQRRVLASLLSGLHSPVVFTSTGRGTFLQAINVLLHGPVRVASPTASVGAALSKQIPEIVHVLKERRPTSRKERRRMQALAIWARSMWIEVAAVDPRHAADGASLHAAVDGAPGDKPSHQLKQVVRRGVPHLEHMLAPDGERFLCARHADMDPVRLVADAGGEGVA